MQSPGCKRLPFVWNAFICGAADLVSAPTCCERALRGLALFGRGEAFRLEPQSELLASYMQLLALPEEAAVLLEMVRGERQLSGSSFRGSTLTEQLSDGCTFADGDTLAFLRAKYHKQTNANTNIRIVAAAATMAIHIVVVENTESFFSCFAGTSAGAAAVAPAVVAGDGDSVALLPTS